MKTILSFSRLAAACVIGFCLAGCHSGVTPRTFVLTPVSTGPAPARAASTNLVIGLKPVKMPGYLSTKSFAMRRNNNEIVYPETLEWAERLDIGMQRVLAANLGSLIPTDQVRFSAWVPGTVAIEIDINVERFDVDSRGEAVLVAWWRVLSPDGENVIASGKFLASRKGPSPDADPQGASASMSGLVGDLAETLAQAIKQHQSP